MKGLVLEEQQVRALLLRWECKREFTLATQTVVNVTHVVHTNKCAYPYHSERLLIGTKAVTIIMATNLQAEGKGKYD